MPRESAPRGPMPRESAAQSRRAPRSRRPMTKLSSTGSDEALRAAEASPLEEKTRDQLYQRAAELGINGRSRMTIDALRTAIAEHERRER